MNKLFDIFLTLLGILNYYFNLKRSFTWDIETIELNQFRKIKRLLIECAHHVPYYKNLFEVINFNPETDFSSIEDLSKIPILKKRTVRRDPQAFINQNNGKNVLEFKTSGSSGNPFCAIVNLTQWVTEQSVVWRSWKLAGYRFRDRIAVLRSYSPEDSKQTIKFDKLRNFIFYSPFHLTEKDMAIYVDHMVEHRVLFLRGYPSSIAILAHYLKKHKTTKLKLKGIFTASEVVSQADRILIEEVFDCKVFDYYGLAEQIVTFSECKYHRGLHNNHEYGYLELLKNEQTGRYNIIGTNLNNTAMPLIRYDTEDLVEAFSLESCRCGYKSISVDRVHGRADTCILTPDGDKISTVNFYTVLEHFPVESWQILQISHEKLEVNFKVGQIAIEEEDNIRARLQIEFSKRIPKNMSVSTVFNKKFIRISEGKKNAFVQLLNEN